MRRRPMATALLLPLRPRGPSAPGGLPTRPAATGFRGAPIGCLLPFPHGGTAVDEETAG